MKKVVLLIISVLLILSCCSCANPLYDIHNNVIGFNEEALNETIKYTIGYLAESLRKAFNIPSDYELSVACVEEIFDSLKDNDDTALRECFSQNAITEATNIDAEIEALFSFVQGDVVSWEQRGTFALPGHTSEYSDGNGGKRKSIDFWFALNTTEQRYYVYVTDYPTDTIDPDNEGLYGLIFIKAEDAIGFSPEARPGIYLYISE